MVSNKGKAIWTQPSWFYKAPSKHLGAGVSSPPVFSSFAHWWMEVNPQAVTKPPVPQEIPWCLPTLSTKGGPNPNETHLTGNLQEAGAFLSLASPPLLERINIASPHYANYQSAPHNSEENLNSSSWLLHPDHRLKPQAMAFFEFFGSGQQSMQQQDLNPQTPNQLQQNLLGVGPVQQLAVQVEAGQEQQLAVPVEAVQEQQLAVQENNSWPRWLEEIPVQQAPVSPVLDLEINLNEPPMPLTQDLNELPPLEGSEEMLIHPNQTTIDQQVGEILEMQRIIQHAPALAEGHLEALEEVIENQHDLYIVAQLAIDQDSNEIQQGKDPQERIVHPVEGQYFGEDQQHLPQLVLELHQQVMQEVCNNLNLNEEVANNLNLHVNADFQPLVLQAPTETSLHIEIPDDEMMDMDMENQKILGQGRQNKHGGLFQNNIQLGMATTFFTNPPESPLSAEPFWLAQMAPKFGDKAEEKDKILIEVPTKWLGLFKALLSAPAQHKWAKQLLESSFPKLLFNENEWTATLSLSCKPCATEVCELLRCEPLIAQEIEEAISEEPDEIMENPSPNKKRVRKGKADTPIVDSAVRRSSRVRANCNGFKMNVCKARNCPGCNSEPPTLSPAILKKIGTSMCDLQDDQLQEQILRSKKKVEPVGKKLKKRKDEEKKHDDHEVIN
jgi:hypothetical protein